MFPPWENCEQSTTGGTLSQQDRAGDSAARKMKKRSGHVGGFREPTRIDTKPRIPLTELAVTIGTTGIGITLFALLVAMVFGRAGADAAADHRVHAELRDPIEKNEIPLGSFSFYQDVPREGAGPSEAPENVRVIEFDVAAIVRGNAEKVLRLESYLFERQHSIREAIDIGVRRSTGTDWSDPTCPEVREAIRTEVNEVLGTEAVEEIHFSSLRTFQVRHEVGL